MSRMLTVALAFVLVATLAPVPAAAPTAEASSCPPAGGDPIALPRATSGGEFVFRGKGWGHGVGMSQYGARGAAELGCTARDILTAYFTDTAIGTADGSVGIRVGLFPNAPTSASTGKYATRPVRSLELVNVGDRGIPWRLRGASAGQHPPTQRVGVRWRVQARAGGTYRILERRSGEWRVIWRGGTWDQPLRANLGPNRLLRIPAKGVRYNRGGIEFRSRRVDGEPRMFVTATLPSIERYLYGLAEMPSSFPDAALRSQAVVGRSFAVVRRNGSGKPNCLCDLYDSDLDQVYRAYDKEAEGTNAQWGRRWVAAVDGTGGRVLRSGGRVVIGNYASSHGGHSDSASFVWGGGAAHLQPVDDSRWEKASENPHSQWVLRIAARDLGRAFGVGQAVRVRTPQPFGASGRVGDPARGHGGVIIEGTQGTVRVSGNEVRTKLGLRSTLFRAINPPS